MMALTLMGRTATQAACSSRIMRLALPSLTQIRQYHPFSLSASSPPPKQTIPERQQVEYRKKDATIPAPDNSWDNIIGAFKDHAAPRTTAAQRWKEHSAEFLAAARPTTSHAKYAGRSVVVTKNYAQAYSKLNTILMRNRVWQELRRSARHEQKGEKRRRLRSERWRKRFKHEVYNMVQLVRQIRRRGG